MIPVVSALAAVHDLGLVHRDLKPDNIFLSRERNRVEPKVLDFGISKAADGELAEALTRPGVVVGTPFYMSPEQANASASIDGKADQYSLGVILYECTTARRPVEERSIYRLVQRVRDGDFAPPRQLNPELPPAFEQIILKGLATDPTERFPTTRALGRALLPFAGLRVRANYGDEFSSDASAQGPGPAQSVPNQSPLMETTLSSSVRDRDRDRDR